MNHHVRVTLIPSGEGVTIEGPHASFTLQGFQPSEIGLSVLEALTGQRVAPPVSYRDSQTHDACGRIILKEVK